MADQDARPSGRERIRQAAERVARTEAATAANVRRRLERNAAELRALGWTVLAPGEGPHDYPGGGTVAAYRAVAEDTTRRSSEELRAELDRIEAAIKANSLYDCCSAAPTQPHAPDCGLYRGGSRDA